MFLRIAPEPLLKRLPCRGFDRYLRLTVAFKKMKVKRTYNPEFTMMEFYCAYTDYEWLMDTTEQC